jgi:hypothetical protein
MTSVPRAGQALAYLRSVVVSDDPSAVHAVSAIIDVANHGGRAEHARPVRDEAQAMLRELFARRLVKERLADEALVNYAVGQGWRRE